MKTDSEIFRKLKKPALLTFFVVLAFGSYLGYIDISPATKNPFALFCIAILPDITATIIIAFFVTLLWDAIVNYEKQKEKKELLADIGLKLKSFWENTGKPEHEDFNRKLLIGVENISRGLSKGDASEIFEMASWYITDCNEIRVIGTVNMNQARSDFESLGVAKCISATETRIKRNKGISYRRITALNLNPKFKEHLEKVFDEKASNKNLELIFLADFSPAYTYLIVDRRFLMVSLTYSKHIEQRYCLFTETNEFGLIDEFIRHFDTLWDEEVKEKKNVIITKRTEFDHIHNIQSRAEEYWRNIKKRINEFPPHETLFQEQALSDLKAFADNFKYDGITSIRHTSANENLILIFIKYLSFLKPGDEYRTITFGSFWKNLISTDNLTDDFINANEMALHTGVVLERLLVIDKKECTLTENTGYPMLIKKIVIENVALMEKQPDYKFRLLFTNAHNEYEIKRLNLAIIKSIQTGETIIFKPLNNDHRIISTDISKDSTVVRAAEKKYSELTKNWEKQAISEDNFNFINSLNLSPEILERLLYKGS